MFTKNDKMRKSSNDPHINLARIGRNIAYKNEEFVNYCFPFKGTLRQVSPTNSVDAYSKISNTMGNKMNN